MTVRFLVYDRLSGRILRSGTCPESMLDLQARREGEVARRLEASSEVSDATHRIAPETESPEWIPEAERGPAQRDRAREQRRARLRGRLDSDANFARRALAYLVESGALDGMDDPEG